MPNLSDLVWLVPLGVVLLYWWQSGEFKGRALELALRQCQQLDLQLLDQSMVITGYWPARNANANFVMRRTYQFEFTSTGQRRYQGVVVLLGLQLYSIELETYIIPESDPAELQS